MPVSSVLTENPLELASAVADDASLLTELVEEALDFAHCTGLAMRTPEHKDRSDVCQAAPMALLPSPFPKRLFEQALEVQGDMLELYHRLSLDKDFLLSSHKEVIKTDEFTRNLVSIYEQVMAEGNRQPKALITQRADYMCNVGVKPEGELKQIEVNNIAVSMGGLAQRVSLWHRRLLGRLGVQSVLEKAPCNRPVDVLVAGIANAWRTVGDPSGVILVVIEDVNQNQIDQRFIEFGLTDVSDGVIVTMRATLTECATRLTVEMPSGNLILDGKHRITVVYFRAGYSPSNYPSLVEWAARLEIERSNAIKCPWIGLQLANTKKIQQTIAAPGIVESYFPEAPHRAKAIRATFAGLWGLEGDDPATLEIIQKAKDNPDAFVLKPQLEGGGGNFYGEEVQEMLRELTPEERAAYILMERIQPLVIKNILLRPFLPPVLSNTVSELGIYGFLLADGARVERLQTGGHILRSKSEDVNEGGVAVGAAVIDSPLLY